jgi:hypothetical protein
MALEAVTAMVSSDAAQPRVVVSGNAAVPWQLLRAVDAALPAYRLFMLNSPRGIPAREGVVHETPFVGVGMRRSPSLAYVPARLSQVPELFGTTCPPDVVLLHTSTEHRGRGLHGCGGQRPAGRDRGMPRPWRGRSRADQPADAVHVR